VTKFSPIDGPLAELWPRVRRINQGVLAALQQEMGSRFGQAIWRLSEAVSEAEFALSWFERYGHGAFIWRAYTQARLAALLAPEYRSALQELDEVAGGRLPAKLPGETMSYEHKFSEEGIRALTERILTHIDAIAKDLARLRGTATASDVRKLRAAVRLGGSLNSRRASSAIKTEFILGEFHFQVYDIVKELGDIKNRRTWSMAKICASVGAAMGVSRFHVSKIVNAYLAEDPDCKERLEIKLILNLAEGATNLPRQKVPPIKKRRKPAAAHAWRR
jgi:hypothetical protein